MPKFFDFRSILENSIIYNTYQRVVGGVRARRLFIENDVNIKSNQKLLDIGCGPGYVIDFLPEVDYVGFDIDSNYIQTAKQKYSNKLFTCSSIADFHIENPKTFDVVMCAGVLHHLNDQEADELFTLAKRALKPNGRLVTLDGCYTNNQNIFAKKLLDLDRGQYVRTEEEYLKLATKHFSKVTTKIDESYFHIPYTSIILQYYP